MPPVEYAITVRPPWSQIIAESAALTALGVEPKLVENRGQMVAAKHFGTDVAIHAGRTWDDGGHRDPRVRNAWKVFAYAIGLREPNPLLAAIGDTRTGSVGVLRPGLWIETGTIIAVATLVGCHQADTPCPEGCGQLAYTDATGQWSCARCGYRTGWTPATCCKPWGEPLHGKRQARHLMLSNVRRLPLPIHVGGKQLVPWQLDPMTVSHVSEALAAVAARTAGGDR